jgi:DNA polymerase-3 subunit epsilon
MKPVLFYDTETNGLPLWNEPSENPRQPHITQLAAELYDLDSGRILAAVDLLIRPDAPDDWTIPEDLQKLTGITPELFQAFGIPIKTALDLFLNIWLCAEVRIGHNESFDARMIRIEGMRRYSPDHQFHNQWKNGTSFCTQTNSTKIINLPPSAKMVAAGRTHAKSPNLGEAYEFFTGKKLEGAHNASVDLNACKQVYFGIQSHLAGVA